MILHILELLSQAHVSQVALPYLTVETGLKTRRIAAGGYEMYALVWHQRFKDMASQETGRTSDK